MCLFKCCRLSIWFVNISNRSLTQSNCTCAKPNNPIKPKKRPLSNLLNIARLRLRRNRKLIYQESNSHKKFVHRVRRKKTLKGRKQQKCHKKEVPLTPKSYRTTRTVSTSSGSMSPFEIPSPSSITIRPNRKRNRKKAEIPVLLPQPLSYSVRNRGRMTKRVRPMRARSRYDYDSDSSSDGSVEFFDDGEEGTFRGIIVACLESFPCGSPFNSKESVS